LRHLPDRQRSLRYLKLTGRSEEQIALVEAYAREQGLFHDAKTPEAEYSELLSLDLATVESSLAGPKRPQDRVVLSKAGESFTQALPSLIKPKAKKAARLRRGLRCEAGQSLGAGGRQSDGSRGRRPERPRACFWRMEMHCSMAAW
jgi:aconitate hydratase